MRLTLSLFGHEIIAISTDTDVEYEEPGDCTTQPIGFAPSPGDQRWQWTDAPDYG